MKWNPRFVAFCRTLGLTPESAPRGPRMNVRFIGWCNRMWDEYLGELGERRTLGIAHRHGKAFDAWLADRTQSHGETSRQGRLFEEGAA